MGASIAEIMKAKHVEASRHQAKKAKTPRIAVASSIDLKRDELTVLTVVITPAVAKDWLSRNDQNNRPISWHTVERYSRDMAARHWDLNGESINFTKDGRLINGQHRLHACVKSGVEFETLVTLGLEQRAMRTLDSGLVRRAGDILAMTRPDVDKSHKVAGVVSMVWRYETGRFLSKTSPTRDEIHDVLDRHPKIMDSVSAVTGNKLAAAALLAFCHYLFSSIDSEMAEIFFAALETGTNLRGEEPVFLLRERLASNRASRAKLSSTEILALMFKAWNLTRAGTKVRSLRWNMNSGEDFPQVEGPMKRKPQS